MIPLIVGILIFIVSLVVIVTYCIRKTTKRNAYIDDLKLKKEHAAEDSKETCEQVQQNMMISVGK